LTRETVEETFTVIFLLKKRHNLQERGHGEFKGWEVARAGRDTLIQQS
jgi:hypothetical protein